MFSSTQIPSKASLMREFSINEQSLKKMDEVPWRQLLSELTLVNKDKRCLLEQLLKSDQQKFTRVEEDALEQLKIRQSQVHDQTILEQGKYQSYLDMRKELILSNQELKLKVEDNLKLLKVIEREQNQVINMESKAIKEYTYLKNQQVYGDHLVEQESQMLKEELTHMRTNEKSQKNDVQKSYKQYIQSQQRLLQKQDQLQNLQNQIKKLDYELELKRLAKLDSQMLLVEIAEIILMSKIFLGQGLLEEERQKKFLDQEYWLENSREQIIENIQVVTFQKSKSVFDLTSYLSQQCQSLIKDEFSLTNFLNMLSDFLQFANGNVMELIERLLLIYQFETMFDISLKNRYDDLNRRINQDQRIYLGLQQTLASSKSHNMILTLQGNLASAIQVDLDGLQPESLNLLEYRFDISARERTQQAQKVIWRVLTFLTNGVYRWVDIIKSLNKLVAVNDLPLSTLIESIELNDNELFKEQKQRAKLIHTMIEENIRGPPFKQFQEQKDIIFSFIKNDFILFNWGSLKDLEQMLEQKGYEFKQFIYVEDGADEQEQQIINIIEGLSTFICFEVKSLTQQAFDKFQQVFTQLLKRFVSLLRGLKRLEKPVLSLYLTGQNQDKQDRNSMISSAFSTRSRQRSEQDIISKKTIQPVKGLFGQAVDFKRSAVLKKCQQYQSYYDEKAILNGSSSRKTILKTVMDSINQIQTTEDQAYDNNENHNIDLLYQTKRQEIFDSQLVNVQMRNEKELVRQLKDKEKSKNYLEKSNRYFSYEKQLSELVKLNQKIHQTASIDFTTLKHSKSQPFSIINSLQGTYTTFKSQRVSKTIYKSQNHQASGNRSPKTPKLDVKQYFSERDKLPNIRKEKQQKFLKIKTFTTHGNEGGSSNALTEFNSSKSQHFDREKSTPIALSNFYRAKYDPVL